MSEEAIDNSNVWFAMSTPYRNELKAKQYLDKLGITNFLPMRYEITERVKGKKRRLVPAVRNLLFVYSSRETIQQAKSGFKNLQYHTKKEGGRNIPLTIPDEQMRQFMSIAETHDEQLSYLLPSEINLEQGTKVRIHGGAFDGVEGVFVKVKGIKDKRVVVSVQGLVSVMTATVHPDLLEIIE